MALFTLQAFVSSSPNQPERSAVRFLFGLWGYFGLVITTAYTGRMHSHMSADAFKSRLSNLRELAEAELPLFLSDVKHETFWLTASKWRNPYEDAVMTQASTFKSIEYKGLLPDHFDRLQRYAATEVATSRSIVGAHVALRRVWPHSQSKDLCRGHRCLPHI
ncbi:uncharacterized protein LOC117642941 [Thrips palmi]|uniref:Uncharacterized protein LOC117642941 n=1 Tax=Thrips palmi TaxID=161013 RepID=A0A6P8ZKP6_THRPL|nr:uncharacterized protein LOC117642941 [Thrips palmi]